MVSYYCVSGCHVGGGGGLDRQRRMNATRNGLPATAFSCRDHVTDNSPVKTAGRRRWVKLDTHQGLWTVCCLPSTIRTAEEPGSSGSTWDHSNKTSNEVSKNSTGKLKHSLTVLLFSTCFEAAASRPAGSCSMDGDLQRPIDASPDNTVWPEHL